MPLPIKLSLLVESLLQRRFAAPVLFRVPFLVSELACLVCTVQIKVVSLFSFFLRNLTTSRVSQGSSQLSLGDEMNLQIKVKLPPSMAPTAANLKRFGSAVTSAPAGPIHDSSIKTARTKRRKLHPAFVESGGSEG